MPNASDLIAQRLYDEGCRYAFGIPGGEVLAIIDALRAAGIEVVLTKHENAAGFMGEGVHHYDGAPAILVATIGPGLANAVNVIANAQQDRVPMIVLTGTVPALDAQTYTHQVFDHGALVREITKAQFKANSNTAGVIADKAVAFATDGQPGPVLIDMPIDVQTADAIDSPQPRRPHPALMGPVAGSVDLKAAREWLQAAERPIVIAGVDVLNQRGEATVAAFCRDMGAPLVATYKAKGVLPEDDPRALGGAGLSPKVDAHLLPLIAQSDCVVLAGYDPIEMRIGWRDPWPQDARVIEFAAVANTHYMHTAAISFVGDVAAGLEALRAGLTPQETWPNGAAAATREAIRAAAERDEAWGPAAVIDAARGGCPRNTVATVDSGAHRILLSQAWDCYEPRGLLQSTALCTMGCALPLAMGRKLAEPDRPVVAFMGDAGLEMVLGELATLRDLRLGLPIIVFVDESLALIEMKQRREGLDNAAVDFGATDFPSLAVAMGGAGLWVDDRDALARELPAAFERDTFTILACRIGRKAYDGRL